MNEVPIIMGYDHNFEKPEEIQVAEYKPSWFEVNFVALGFWAIVLVAVAFVVLPIF